MSQQPFYSRRALSAGDWPEQQWQWVCPFWAAACPGGPGSAGNARLALGAYPYHGTYQWWWYLGKEPGRISGPPGPLGGPVLLFSGFPVPGEIHPVDLRSLISSKPWWQKRQSQPYQSSQATVLSRPI